MVKTICGMAAALLLLSTGAVDFASSDIYQPYLKRTNLSGVWKLKRLDSSKGNPVSDVKYFAPQTSDADWEEDVVPGDLTRPYGVADNDNSRKLWGGVTCFRRQFTPQALLAGEKAYFHFDNILGEGKIYLNNKLIYEKSFTPLKEHRSWLDAFEVEVTKELLPGRVNTLAVRLFHNGEPAEWGRARPSGIYGQVWLDVRPAVWADAILITPAANLRDVEFACHVNGGSPDKWRAEVFAWQNPAKIVATAEVTPGKTGWAQGRFSLDNPQLWSPESPSLYGLAIKNAKNEIVGVQRFGMRTFVVKDGNFLLNGKPTALRGLCWGEEMFTPFGPAAFHNDKDLFRQYFAMFRAANVNHLRLHTCMVPPGAYDILDELGFIITDELDYPTEAIEGPARADHIVNENLDSCCDNAGNLKDEFRAKVTRRMYQNYSHPSICTFSFGNEMRDEKRVAAMFRNLYDLYRSLDRQNRPITPSSGRFWKDADNIASLQKVDKLDYIDTHDYTGSINNWPLGYCQNIAEKFIREARKSYPALPPVVNGETVYFANHYYPWMFDRIWTSEDAAEPDWSKLMYVLTEMRDKMPANRMMSFYWARNWGWCNYKYHRAEGRGIYTERILEVNRKLWPDWDGYENLSGDYFTINAARDGFVPNEAYLYLQKVNSPAIAVFDYIFPNRYTGETVKSKVTVVNNTESELKAAKLLLNFGQTGVGAIDIGPLPQGGKKVLDCAFVLPSQTGRARLDYRLFDGDKLLSDRQIYFNLRDKMQVVSPVVTDRKVALYDPAAVLFAGLKKENTTRVLKTFSLPVAAIDNFDGLKNFDLLIIGANAFDDNLRKNAKLIRQYVENGGRVLVFEQNATGRVPFLPELELALAGPGQFSEVLQRQHPALAGLDQWEFFNWGQKDWSVYRVVLLPFSPAALLAGGDTTQWGSDKFGMAVAHVKVGKGDIIFTQAESVPTFGADAASTQFTRQLLQSMLSDSSRANARDFIRLPVQDFEFDEASAFFVSLTGAANFGFADETAYDGKGGFPDQGADNDLRNFPTGRQILGGIPFEIASGAKTIVVLSENPKLHFSPRSALINVDRRAAKLIFLHTGAWIDQTKPQSLGTYTVTYVSGKTVEIPIVGTVNLSDWWDAPNNPVAAAQCVWSGQNGRSVVGVYAFMWRNPDAGDAIKTIQLSARKDAVIGLIAVTGEATK